MKDKIEECDKNIKELTDYILLKIKTKDWHAVADAAVDIREIEARKKTLLELEPY